MSVTKREQCPECADSGNDNLVTHDNGSVYCYACSYQPEKSTPKTTSTTTIDPGRFLPLKARCLSKETCEKFGTTVAKYTGYLGKNMFRDKATVVFNMFSQGELVKQKIRALEDRSLCTQKGATEFKELFGMHAHHPNEKMFITVTEGEFDAMAIYEATGYPAVSVTKGAKGAKGELADNLEWLMKWKYVVLAFDNDEPGREAAHECLELFEPGKVRICFFPSKDANDMLVEGRNDEIKNSLWQAEEVFPKDLVQASDISERILEQPTQGPSWPWPELTDITYGFHPGKVYVVAGGTGIGKTEVIKELILHQAYRNDVKCALFSFEQAAEDTFRRLIGGRINIPLHIPGTKIDPKIIHHEIKNLEDRVYVFDRKASSEELLSFDSITNKIKTLSKGKGVKLIVIDNLKAISATLQDKFHGIEQCMCKLQSIASAYDVTFLIVSHLAKDKRVTKAGQEDDSWGRGRMPVLENIYGSSAIEAIADVVLVLARNADSQDPYEKLITKVKCLKSRLDGTKRGIQFNLFYDDNKGRLISEEEVL